jgi:hypothetical protein
MDHQQLTMEKDREQETSQGAMFVFENDSLTFTSSWAADDEELDNDEWDDQNSAASSYVSIYVSRSCEISLLDGPTLDDNELYHDFEIDDDLRGDDLSYDTIEIIIDDQTYDSVEIIIDDQSEVGAEDEDCLSASFASEISLGEDDLSYDGKIEILIDDQSEFLTVDEDNVSASFEIASEIPLGEDDLSYDGKIEIRIDDSRGALTEDDEENMSASFSTEISVIEQPLKSTQTSREKSQRRGETDYIEQMKSSTFDRRQTRRSLVMTKMLGLEMSVQHLEQTLRKVNE